MLPGVDERERPFQNYPNLGPNSVVDKSTKYLLHGFHEFPRKVISVQTVEER